MDNLGQQTAFPRTYTAHDSDDHTEYLTSTDGMTIRTYAAIEAMKAMLSNSNLFDFTDLPSAERGQRDRISSQAILQADDLIEKLSK